MSEISSGKLGQILIKYLVAFVLIFGSLEFND